MPTRSGRICRPLFKNQKASR